MNNITQIGTPGIGKLNATRKTEQDMVVNSCQSFNNLPQMVKVEIFEGTKRGYHLIHAKTGTAIKYVNGKEAIAIMQFNYMFMYHYNCKRLTGEEYNQFVLHKYLKQLVGYYESTIFYEDIPKVKRVIVVKREDNPIISGYQVILDYEHSSYSLNIPKPIFKALRAETYINYRFASDKLMLSDHNVERC